MDEFPLPTIDENEVQKMMDEFPLPTIDENEVQKMMDELRATLMQPTEEYPAQPQPAEESSRATIVLDVKVPRLKDRIPIEMGGNDTVLKLKEKILNHGGMLQAMPMERIVLQSHRTGVEMLDQKLLKDYAALEYRDNEIDVFIKTTLPKPRRKQVMRAAGSRSGGGGEFEKLMVIVLPMHGKDKIRIQVNAKDMVSVLREKLEDLHREFGLPLTPDGGPYFLIHKQMPMDEKMSFQWHGVEQGDTIETFSGFITEN